MGEILRQERKPTMRTLRTLFIVMLLPLLSFAAHAQPAAYSASDGIVVEIQKGTVVHLPGMASVVAVADPEVADVDVLAPNLVSVQGRGVGQTTLVAFNERGDEILNETITVNHNISRLTRVIQTVMPGSEVRFSSVDGALVLSGKVSSPLEADNIRRMVEPFIGEDQLVNMLEVQGSDQVMLKVRVAEISRAELKRFGINLAAVLTSGSFAFGLVTGRDIGAGDVANIVRGGDDNSLGLNYNGSNLDINSVIDALAEDNLIKVLAEPNLTTASGRSANFLAGGEFPVPVPGQDGQVTIEYRQYGVGLQFTPQVLSKEKISLTVAPEVSELSQVGAVQLQGFNIPGLVTRRAETTVELGSGQSFAIAGLLQNNHTNNVNKFPILGDLPVLGSLFRSSEFQQNQTELMILVTPYIVRGVPSEQLTDPTQGYVTPTDAERVLMGRMYSPEPDPASAPDRQPAELRASPADMRKSRFRRSMAAQRSAYKPSKTTTDEPMQAAPVKPVASEHVLPAPATLNGPVGVMIR